jgi:hypothetical protein
LHCKHTSKSNVKLVFKVSIIDNKESIPTNYTKEHINIRHVQIELEDRKHKKDTGGTSNNTNITKEKGKSQISKDR